MLAANPERTHNPEIVAFYDRFWRDTNATQRAQIRALVESGQLEFIGGGWSQNDEACVRFEDTLDQLTLGHLWEHSILGQSFVSTAWQADPFGHR